VKIADALLGMKELYIETAPFIYFVEQNPTYVNRMREIFRQITAGNLDAVSSVITLTEVLAHPLKQGNATIAQAYRKILSTGRHFTILPITLNIAERAAEMRAIYNLRTPDALQIASALEAHSDAFLTNDRGLQRVTEIAVILVDDLDEVPPPPTP
jgi:predicted nucleic acid-binding protein